MKTMNVVQVSIILMLSAAAAIAQDTAWLNAKDFGAKGDGKTDDTKAVMNVIQAASGLAEGTVGKNVCKKVFFPVGTYLISETITLGSEHGGLLIEGVGVVTGQSLSGQSTLLWAGAAGEPLMQAWAMKGLRIDNMVFDGASKAGTLLRVNSTDSKTKDKKWLDKYKTQASSGYYISRTVFKNAAKGITLSDDAYMCSDCSIFFNVTFNYLDTAFEANSEQNLCYTFIQPNFGYVGTAIKFKGGGSVNASVVNCHHTDVVFDIEKCGINSGVFDLSNIRPEQGGKTKGKRPVILKASGEVNVKITSSMTTAGLYGDDETPAFILGPSVNLVVESSMICGKIARLTGAKGELPTFITFRNCRFRVSSDPLREGRIDCDDFSGFRLSDCQVEQDEIVDNVLKVNGRYFISDYSRLYGRIKSNDILTIKK